MNSSAGKRHGLDPGVAGSFASGAIILPAEGDAVIVEGDEAAVGDGDPVGVAGEIGEHRLRPAERALGVDDPLGFAQRRERGVEGGPVRQAGEITEEG